MFHGFRACQAERHVSGMRTLWRHSYHLMLTTATLMLAAVPVSSVAAYQPGDVPSSRIGSMVGPCWPKRHKNHYGPLLPFLLHLSPSLSLSPSFSPVPYSLPRSWLWMSLSALVVPPCLLTAFFTCFCLSLSLQERHTAGGCLGKTGHHWPA